MIFDRPLYTPVLLYGPKSLSVMIQYRYLFESKWSNCQIQAGLWLAEVVKCTMG